MKFLLYTVFFCGFGVIVWSKAGCDHRYFQHYLVKDCEPEYGPDDSQCPIRFNCPPPSPPETSGCRFQGKVIPPGEDIQSGNPCQLCSCHPARNRLPPEIVCISVECPSAFGHKIEESCYQVYEKDRCCSSSKECGETPEPRSTCEHEGKTYHLGEHIYSGDDQCVVCICGEEWTGDVHTDPNCRRHACILEKDLERLKSGCLPIYHESTCCPIEYDCGEKLPNTTIPSATDEDVKSGNTCVFKGSHYRIGQILDIAHPTNCVTCECTTPPEFTCIHRKCEYPDDPNCVPTYSRGECCPTFDCTSRN